MDFDRHFNRWLRAMSGCEFVKKLAPTRVRFQTFKNALSSTTPRHLNTLVAGCREEQKAGVAVFPFVRNERETLQLLRLLDADPSWRLTQLAETTLEGDVYSLEWQTKGGLWSQAMGFAPMFSMPVTRRAPWVAIALWPGPQTKSEGDRVGFRDMDSGLEPGEHKRLVKTTRKAVRAAMSGDASPWGNVAFRFFPPRPTSSPPPAP